LTFIRQKYSFSGWVFLAPFLYDKAVSEGFGSEKMEFFGRGLIHSFKAV
jgi:hypothetical protein